MLKSRIIPLFFALIFFSCIEESRDLLYLNSHGKYFKVNTINFTKFNTKPEIGELMKLADEKGFEVTHDEYLTFGITPKYIGIYFDLNRMDDSDWILEIPYPPLLNISVFQIDERQNIFKETSGISTPSNLKYSEHPFYQFPIINKTGKIRIFLILKADDPLTTPILIWNKNYLSQIDGYRHLAFGLFFGIILSLVLYNLLLFLTIRDLTYLYYVCYISSFGIFLFFMYGYAGYINRSFVIEYETRFIPLFALLTSVFADLFSRRFLNVSQFSKFLNRSYFVVIFLGLFLVCIYFFISKEIEVFIANLHPLISAAIILSSTIVAIKKKYKAAIYFLIAWGGLLFSVILFIAANLTLIPANFYSQYLQIPGVAFEAILLSLALGYRINELRSREEKTRIDALQKEILAREKQEKMSQSFKRFVPGEFLKNLNKESILEIKQGDSVVCKMSVLFTDIRGFTNLSENLDSEKVFSFLNTYLEKMEPIIQKHEGFIDKFIGDAIMALFPDEKKSVQAALEMIRISNEFLLPNHSPLEIGIGIHSGELILGTIGSPSRIDTTVIGDTVNVASRIESLNKVYNTKLLVSEDVIRSFSPTKIFFREIDLVLVMGKEKPILLYEILSENP